MARAMSRSFLIVLPKEMRSASRRRPAPSRFRRPRRCRNWSPWRRAAQDFRRRIGLHRVVDLAVRQGFSEGMEIVATTSRSTTRQGPSGRRVARKSRMRCHPHGTSRWRPRNHENAVSQRVRKGLSRLQIALSALDWRDDPPHLAGNDGVPLQNHWLLDSRN
jgi:hypothetical protein